MILAFNFESFLHPPTDSLKIWFQNNSFRSTCDAISPEIRPFSSLKNCDLSLSSASCPGLIWVDLKKSISVIFSVSKSIKCRNIISTYPNDMLSLLFGYKYTSNNNSLAECWYACDIYTFHTMNPIIGASATRSLTELCGPVFESSNQIDFLHLGYHVQRILFWRLDLKFHCLE